MTDDTRWIGMVDTDETDPHDGYKAADSETTREQIESILTLDLRVRDDPDQEFPSWDAVYRDEFEGDTPILNHIIEDREMRVDDGEVMMNRPPFAIATIEGDAVVRLEYYTGHNVLEPSFDLREDPSADLDPTYTDRY